MKIADYTRAKFEIADLLRTAVPKVRQRNPAEHYPFNDLFARLAADRFNVAVVGQFSRGKTSLMNAMLNTNRLPTGILPLTSVITTVQYGPTERAVIEYQDSRFPYETPLDALHEYVSQSQNPGNEKGVKFARVELPSELLRQGFFLVDTPGIGSAVVENTRTTEAFLPEADAIILVTSYDSPLSSEEYWLLKELGAWHKRIFLVINKRDLFPVVDQTEVETHIRELMGEMLSDSPPEVFSLSARDAIDAQQVNDRARFVASGVPAFIERLIRFLTEEKESVFLQGIIARTTRALFDAGTCAEELDRLQTLRQSLFDSVDQDQYLSQEFQRLLPAERFIACQVCSHIEQQIWDFLRQFQYHITIDREARGKLSDAGGLCPFHTWQYAGIASTHGTCIAFPAVIDRLADHLSALLDSGPDFVKKMAEWQPVGPDQCILCRISEDAEAAALAKVRNFVAQAQNPSGYPGLCVPHLSAFCRTAPDAPKSLLSSEVENCRRVAEDMRRYALKRDGSGRAFTTSDETDSDIRGLRLLAGHRRLRFTPPDQ